MKISNKDFIPHCSPHFINDDNRLPKKLRNTVDAVVINACDVVYISNIPVPISLTADVTVLNVPSLTVSLNACAALICSVCCTACFSNVLF